MSALDEVLAMVPGLQPGLSYQNPTRRLAQGAFGTGKTWALISQLPAFNAPRPVGLAVDRSGSLATERDLDCLIAEAQLVPGDMAAPDESEEAAERSAVLEVLCEAQVAVIVQRDD